MSCHLEASRTFLLQKKCPNSGPVACTGQRQGPKVPRRNCRNEDSDREDSVTAQGLTAGDKDSILTHGWKGLFPIRPQSFPASLSSSSTRQAVVRQRVPGAPLRPQSSPSPEELSGAQSLSLGPWFLIHEPKQPLGPSCLAPALSTYLGQAQSGPSS